MQNPNAFAAALTSALVWLLNVALTHWHVVDLSSAQLLGIAGGATTIVLWIGRVGLIGAWRRLMNGAQTVVKGSASQDGQAQ